MNSQAINLIGEELCQCRDNCKGIRQNQEKGDFSRGLIFESGENKLGLGTVVCGLNPGTALQTEKKFVLEHGGNYSASTEFWKSIRGIRYFDRPRRLIRGLGRTGPILWTDMVKCENESSEVELEFRKHSSTFRHCTSKFLLREIALIPKDWLIICLGWESYRGITYMCPDRATLGIPHPAAYGLFTPFFDGERILKDAFRKHISDYFDSNPKGTIWVDPTKALT